MTAIFSGIVGYNLNTRCNLKCGMCGLPKLREPPEEPSTEEVLSSLSSFPFCSDLTLTGGEIFLREDLAQIVVAAAPITSTILLSTNGTMTSRIKELLLGLSFKVRKQIGVIVSLDGATPETHDKSRGVKGTWNHTVETIQMVRALGLPRRATMTIQPNDYHEIWAAYQYCKSLDTPLSFLMLAPRPEFSPEQVKDIYEQLKLVWTDAGIPGFEYYLRGLIYHYITLQAPLPCVRSKYTSPVITAGGDVYPCDNAPWRNLTDNYYYPELIMGNIRNKSLVEILNSKKAAEALGRLDSEHCNVCWQCSFDNTARFLKTLPEKELRDFTTRELESLRV